MSARDYADRSVYRRRVEPAGLARFTVKQAQSDLHVSAVRDLSAEAGEALKAVRAEIEAYLAARPGFAGALDPWPDDPEAPATLAAMIHAACMAGVGPMAAVAGAVAGRVGRALLPESPELIVENGGDVFLASEKPRVAAVFAGGSSLSMRLGIRLQPAPQGVAVCASSGTVGPSLSRGRADAAVIVSADECLADAAATALGNRVASVSDLAAAMEWAESVEGVDGALAVIGEDLAAWGAVELVQL